MFSSTSYRDPVAGLRKPSDKHASAAQKPGAAWSGGDACIRISVQLLATSA
jgi:hypothetical protein